MEYSLYSLTSADSIGNTLSSVNQNYLVLDQLIQNIQLSAQKFWIPMIEYYNQRKPYLMNAVNLVIDNYQNWQSSSSTFETNSSKWITPLVLWYPTVMIMEESRTLPEIAENRFLAWLNALYPPFSPDNSVPNFLEGQRAIIYSFNYEQDVPTLQSFNLIDYTTCQTADEKICAYCAKCYSGSVGCGEKGTFNCNGCSYCSRCANLPCNFDNGLKTKDARIVGDIRIDYSNKYESQVLNAYVFKIQDCRWEFDTFLTQR